MTNSPASHSNLPDTEQQLIQRALKEARDTKVLAVADGARYRVPELFVESFGGSRGIVIADKNTFEKEGADVQQALQKAGIPTDEPFLFPDDVYGESTFVEMLESRLRKTQAIPIAVGAGSINDLAKLAAHRQNRRYMSVATAASMDGYTAYGASITHIGSKQTFDCPAPLVVAADLEVIRNAPPSMNASGYADLLAKGVAGADWILADALGEEPIHPLAWSTVQDALPSWVDHPEGVASSDPETLRRLVVGLMMGGFAMQASRSSRPASGAEHQFSHLWDMQHHTHNGAAPSHGFKVGIGTLASLALYKYLLAQDLTKLDIDQAVANWPTLSELEKRIESSLGEDRELADKGLEESRAKYRDHDYIRNQLTFITQHWNDIRFKLEKQLRPFEEAREMLRKSGSPFEPEQIGISQARLQQSYEQAFYIRRRFTVLDFAMRTGLLQGGGREASPHHNSTR